MGEWQKEQRTLQGSLCSMDFSVGSYHSRSWWPWVKFMSSLWKMAAHWKGAAINVRCVTCLNPIKMMLLTVLGLTGGAMAQLAVQRLPSAELVLDFSAMAVGLILDIEVVGLLVDTVRCALFPL